MIKMPHPPDATEQMPPGHPSHVQRSPSQNRASRNKAWKALKGPWFQPRTRNYIHAFIDGILSFLIVMVFSWGVLSLVRSGSTIDYLGNYEFKDFQNFMVASNTYLSLLFSTVCGISIGSFMKSLGAWRLRSAERGRRVVLGSLRVPVWAYGCAALSTCFVLSMLASQSIKMLSEVHQNRQGVDTFYCRLEWFVVLNLMCLFELAAITAGALIRERKLAPREEALGAREEKHAGSQSSLGHQPGGMV